MSGLPKPSDILTTLIAGLGTGCLYALFVLGIILMFRVSKQVSFAYGQTGMIAALGSWFLYEQRVLPVWMALVAGLGAAIVISGATEMFVIRRASRIRPSFDLIVTLGMFLVLTAAAEQVFGSESHAYVPLLADRGWNAPGAYLNMSDPLVAVMSGSIIVIAYLAIKRTGLGVSIRACAEDPAIAQSFGVNVGLVRTGVWMLGGLIAGLVSILFASRLFVDTSFMLPILINGFVAAMVGGLERFWAPVLVAVLLGAYESLVGLFFGSTASVPAIFVVLIVVLTAAPSRWIADEQVRP
ncbi:branched-chain amino acid ABC transporter permease [Dactylosporangium maewongense]|uniref:Branched-chain amino acid ABC transporter permease n=1 Tax=Dactylosporangium maewongense TaxID=634393 RepID=A0ABP4PA87_9ACTN